MDDDGVWYHLGGCGDTKSKRQPTVFVLKYDEQKQKWIWPKAEDQSRAKELYEKHGKHGKR